MPNLVPEAQAGFQSHVFGGRNRRGFLGGGYYEGSPENYELPEYGAMNFRYDAGAQQAQDAMRGNFYAGSPLAQQQDVRNMLSNSLFGVLGGTTPSIAQQQLQNTTQQNVANALALAQASPGGRGAGRMAMQSMGDINAQAAGQAALLRAQEIANAQNALGALRGQDIGLYDMLGRSSLGYLAGQQNLNQQLAAQNMQYERDRLAAFTNQPAGVMQTIGNLAGQVGGVMTGIGLMGRLGGGGAGLGQTFGAPGPGASTGYGAFTPETTFSAPPQMIPMARGGYVPGYAHGGTTDTESMDTVPAMLSPGEIVLPRSVANAPDAAEKAKAFVQAIKRQYSKGGYVRC